MPLNEKKQPLSLCSGLLSVFFFTGLFIFVLSSVVMSQSQPPVKTRTANTKDMQKDTGMTIEQKLVELALQGPAHQVSEHQLNIAKYQVKVAKNSWFNLLSISTNYNDRSFAKIDNNNNQAYIYPKYFFGVNIPLGLFFTKGPEVKVAKETYKLTANNVEINKGAIKVEILSKYKQYLSLNELLILQESVIAEVSALYIQTEKKFSNGTTTLDTYNSASKRYNDELSKRINLNLQRDILLLEIEQIIGIPLESLIRK